MSIASTLLGLVTAVPVLMIRNQPCFGGGDEGARDLADEMAKSAAMFELQAGRPPASANVLVDPPRPLRPIMDALPCDPGGASYLLASPGVRGEGRVNAVSAGADGVFFTADDVGNWQPERRAQVFFGNVTRTIARFTR